MRVGRGRQRVGGESKVMGHGSGGNLERCK